MFLSERTNIPTNSDFNREVDKKSEFTETKKIVVSKKSPTDLVI